MEDSKKRQHTVNWEDQSDCKTEEHELMIDSGCFGTCLSTLDGTAIPNGEFHIRRSCGSKQRGAATQRTESGLRTCDDEQWWTNFDPDHI